MDCFGAGREHKLNLLYGLFGVLGQQMDVWFCLMQESSAERHCCVTVDPDQTNCQPSGARPGILCFSLDFDLHRCGQPGHNPVMGLLPSFALGLRPTYMG